MQQRPTLRAPYPVNPGRDYPKGVFFGTISKRKFPMQPLEHWAPINRNPFSPYGRISRIDYLLFSLLPELISVFVMHFFVFHMMESQPDSARAATLSFVLPLAVGLVNIVAIINAVKRCHDLKRSGWFLLWYLVPFATVVAMVYLLSRSSRWTEPSGTYSTFSS